METVIGKTAEDTSFDPDNLYGDESSVAVAISGPKAVMVLGGITGDVKPSDIVLPRLQIIQSVGPLSRQFNPGDMILSKEFCVAKANASVNFIALFLKKYFRERFDKFDMNGPRPRTFNNEAEVFDAKLVLDWVSNKPPTAEPVADVVLLMEKPEGQESPRFSVQLDTSSKDYALVIWTVQRTAYTRVAKRLFTAQVIELASKGLMSGLWRLTVREANINGNLIFAPNIELIGRVEDATIEEIKSKLK